MSWFDELARTEKGGLRATLGNALRILENDERFDGLFRLNVFSDETMLMQKPPWVSAADDRTFPAELRDEDITRLVSWLQDNYEGVSFSADKAVAPAVDAVAAGAKYDPVREYLDGLVWDGVERCEDWLADFLGAEQTEFVRAIAKRWLISAVARVYVPGVKADHVLIFEGLQGKKKSTALEVLGGEWFKDEELDTHGREGAISLQGVWIYEIAEFSSFKKGQIESVKAFVTRRIDRFRPMYGRRTVKRPRRCVFAASTNDRKYLSDSTGNRRFWPFLCTYVNVDGLRRWRDQLWAEAVVRYRRGECWWLETPELEALAAAETEERYEGDVWEEELECWAKERRDTTILDAFRVLTGGKTETIKVSRADAMRMGVVLRRLGFTETRRPNGGDRTRVYYKPQPEPELWSPWTDDGQLSADRDEPRSPWDAEGNAA